ncbi:hypothetical protein MLD38_035287 [Melastoma candidum]|uniref:Uncharacterized protein n=1 Tax=Melastoma candidum TaxID=119954 RepID=A0ACB9MES2_9MYRT|nr:hypothetical protein MLD38_035287 [Melastoma candidum]
MPSPKRVCYPRRPKGGGVCCWSLLSRFFLQPLGPTEAAQRAKESAKDILNVKSLIDKKAWPYVQNDLHLKAEYLCYDLNTVISAKSKDERKSLKELT